MPTMLKVGEKGATEDEMVRWHHQLNEYDSEPTPGNSKIQGSRGCCRPWGCKESDTTERLNSNSIVSTLRSLGKKKLKYASKFPSKISSPE